MSKDKEGKEDRLNFYVSAVIYIYGYFQYKARSITYRYMYMYKRLYTNTVHACTCTVYIVVAVRSLHSMSAASVNAMKASHCNYFVESY